MGSQGRLTRGPGGHTAAHIGNSHNHHSHIRNREAPLQRIQQFTLDFRFLSHGGFYHSHFMPPNIKCLINRDETPMIGMDVMYWLHKRKTYSRESRRIPRLRYATVQCRLRATFPLISYTPPSPHADSRDKYCHVRIYPHKYIYIYNAFLMYVVHFKTRDNKLK